MPVHKPQHHSETRGSSPKGRWKRRADAFLPAIFTAVVAALVMAGVCIMAVNRIQETRHAPVDAFLAAPDPSKARILPQIGQFGLDSEERAPEGLLTEEDRLAVAVALRDLQSLPFEEPLGPSLDERIMLVDYALIQAARQHRLPPESARLSLSEERSRGLESYHFQTIDVLPGAASSPYIISLRDSLKGWVAGAELHRVADNEWMVVIDGLETHQIRLHPGRNSLLPPELAGANRRRFTPPTARRDGEPARLVIVIDDLGANMSSVRLLLGLDFPVTFSFWPHAPHSPKGARAAHQAGREVIVHQPMEPLGYPGIDPGPDFLRPGMRPTEIGEKIRASVLRVPHAAGLNNHMGSRFTQSRTGSAAVAEALSGTGLFLLDSLTHPGSVLADEAEKAGLRTLRRDVFLDDAPSRKSVLNQLAKAERIALLTGRCIAIGHPRPETLEALREWQRTRNREIEIVRLQDL